MSKTFIPVAPLAAIILGITAFVAASPGTAEYGDVVLNQRSDKEGVRPVVFSHWFHRIRYRCSVCHSELGFKMRAGANEVLMADVNDGKFCGACHNGQIAWAADRCDLCHSGRPGLKSDIYGGDRTLGPGRW
jgi:c(7)-type cytochrome triheme protein